MYAHLMGEKDGLVLVGLLDTDSKGRVLKKRTFENCRPHQKVWLPKSMARDLLASSTTPPPNPSFGSTFEQLWDFAVMMHQLLINLDEGFTLDPGHWVGGTGIYSYGLSWRCLGDARERHWILIEARKLLRDLRPDYPLIASVLNGNWLDADFDSDEDWALRLEIGYKNPVLRLAHFERDALDIDTDLDGRDVE